MLAFAVVLSFLADRCMADASTFCMYSLLTETHAIALQCGHPLDTAAETRYQQLVAEMRNSIIHNTHQPGKTAADVQDALKKSEAATQARYQKAGGDFCTSKDYADYQAMLLSFTTPENSQKILESVRRSKDPNKGECI
ncbi:MAG: hypothetical protein JO208_09735 [Alphaproteobacteria bacterium]|nr:hypothetical protein [Alphaproteobacteria bacterium]